MRFLEEALITVPELQSEIRVVRWSESDLPTVMHVEYIEGQTAEDLYLALTKDSEKIAFENYYVSVLEQVLESLTHAAKKSGLSLRQSEVTSAIRKFKLPSVILTASEGTSSNARRVDVILHSRNILIDRNGMLVIIDPY